MNQEEFLTSLRKANIILTLNEKGGLAIDGPEAVLTPEVVSQIKTRKEEIISYLQSLQDNRSRQHRIEKTKEAKDYPLSSSQLRLWMTEQIHIGSHAYHIVNTLEWKGAFDPGIYEKAVLAVIERHEILRTIFRQENSLIRQRVLTMKEVDLKIPYIDLHTKENAAELADKIIEEDKVQTFDLGKGPLIRLMLIRLEEHLYLLYSNLHHIIGDGWSMNVLSRDILSYYHAYLEGRTPVLPPLEIQYKDYATWEQVSLEEKSFEKDRLYWLKQLSGQLPVIDLPIARRGPQVMTRKGWELAVHIDKRDVEQLKTLCSRHNCTLFMGLLGVLNVLLYRYTGLTDVLIGTPVAGRDDRQLVDQIGFYIKTLALRTRFEGGDSFVDLLKKIRLTTLEAFQHQHYPFDQIIQELPLQRDPGRSPLFDMLLILQNQEQQSGANKLSPPAGAILDIGPVEVKFDLSFEFLEETDGLCLKVQFDTDLYDRSSIDSLIGHLGNLLQIVTKQPDREIRRLEYLSPQEHHRLLVELNNTTLSYPPAGTIVDLFGEQVMRRPEHAALILDENLIITYRELDDLSRRVAFYLCRRGIKKGDRIPVCMHRPAARISAILGILKAGAVYVPLENDYPAERINFILQDTNAAAVITDKASRYQIQKEVLVIDMDEEWPEVDAPTGTVSSGQGILPADVDPAAPVCVIYTSGTTGSPKGVVISNGSVINRLQWMWREFPFSGDECSALKTSIGFVDHLWELYGPLLKGIPSVLFTREEVLDAALLIRKLDTCKVTRLVLVPSLLSHLLKELESKEIPRLPHLHYWTCSGEILTSELVDDFYSLLPDRKLLNIYGSTEVTADATCYEVPSPVLAPMSQEEDHSLFSLSVKEDMEQLEKEFTGRREIIDMAEGIPSVHDYRDVSIGNVWDRNEYISFLRNELLPGTVNMSRPGFMGHMTGPLPNLVQEINSLMVTLNQNMVKIDTSFAATLVERQVIGIVHKLVFSHRASFYHQYVQNADACLGVITGGGALSNITALSYALNKALPAGQTFKGVAREGVIKAAAYYGYKGIVVISSQLAHYSIDKAMRTFGLGTEHIIRCNLDKKNIGQGKKDLIDKIAALQKQQILVLAIIGVAGATETGQIDPLDELADIAGQFGIHYHVDAAFGGGLLFSESLSSRLRGINRASSVTICGHKQLYLPMGASICVFKSPDLASWSENNAYYQARKGSYDLGRYSIEGSRPFVSLLLHAVLKLMGRRGYGDVILDACNKVKVFAEIVRSMDEFQLLKEPELNILVYRYLPTGLRARARQALLSAADLESINHINRALQKAQFSEGRYFVSYSEIEFDGQDLSTENRRTVILRLVLMNPATTENDFRDLLQDQIRIALELEQEHLIKLPALLVQGKTYKSPFVHQRNIPIGKPMGNCRVYLLDGSGELLPPGAIGEVYIGGAGVALGYLGRPDLTAEKFLEDPFHPGGKVYRTGDMGRWLADGNLEYLGRIDEQVKIRGHRIEPMEVEQALGALEGIERAAVAAHISPGGDKYLVGYVVSSSRQTSRDLRQALLHRLPEYMIPGYFMQIERLPVTANGKVDKRSLPLPDVEDPGMGAFYEAPRTKVEWKMAEIWQRVLVQERPVGRQDDFFSLGGHSLRVMQLINEYEQSFGVRLTMQDLFYHTTLESHTFLLTGRGITSFHHIDRIAEGIDYAVSEGQQRLWLLSQEEEASRAYHLRGSLRLEGRCSVESWQRAMGLAMQRHEILRTVFRQQGEELRQVVLGEEDQRVELERWCITGRSGEEVAAEVWRWSSGLFDLERGPLFRVLLVEGEDEGYRMYYTMHHIIGDGWSLELLGRELLGYYELLERGESVPMALLPIQYKDYAAWQNGRMSGPIGEEHRYYWLKQLSGEIPALELPARAVRPSVQQFEGHILCAWLGEDLWKGLEKLGLREGSTMFMVLLAGLKVLLHRYTGQEDIIVGSPVAGRGHAELEDQIGFYINTLALRTEVKGNERFVDLLKKVREVTVGGYAHQEYPFDRLVEELGGRRDRSRSALFDVFLNYQPQLTAGGSLSAEEPEGREGIWDGGRSAAKLDWLVNIHKGDKGGWLYVEYNSGLYERELMERMIVHYKEVLRAVVEEPEMLIGDFSYMGSGEVQEVLGSLRGEVVPKGEGYTLLDIWSASVESYNDRVALRCGEEVMSYGEVDRLSEGVRMYLREERGVVAGQLVGVSVDRSDWLVVLLLGIWKGGWGYVAVDPAYPEERRRYMQEDSGCVVMVDEGELGRMRAWVQSGEWRVENSASVHSEQVAYVLYTSGSTGRPKGVTISHGNLYAYIRYCGERYFKEGGSKIGLWTSLSFDLTVTSLYGWMMGGGELRVYGGDQDVRSVLEEMMYGGEGITFLKCTPAHIGLLEGLERGDRRTGVRQVVVGGEALLWGHIRRLRELLGEGVIIYNEYGPTETTVGCVVEVIDGTVPLGEGGVSIGRAIPGMWLRILDSNGRQVGRGITGELAIGGVQVGQGYWGRAELTSGRFVSDAYGEGRLYLTGDLCRQGADGRLWYMGRRDDQVKVHGHRIELGEVEAVMSGLEGVEGAAVRLQQEAEGEGYLVGYVVGSRGEQEVMREEELLQQLRERLPVYMVPRRIVRLDQLPVTANGKIDRKALSLPEDAGTSRNRAYEAPRNEVETRLVELWKEVLQFPGKIGIKDNFFELGGHSIRAIKILSKVSKEFGVVLSLQKMFEDPTIENIASEILNTNWFKAEGKGEEGRSAARKIKI